MACAGVGVLMLILVVGAGSRPDGLLLLDIAQKWRSYVSNNKKVKEGAT